MQKEDLIDKLSSKRSMVRKNALRQLNRQDKGDTASVTKVKKCMSLQGYSDYYYSLYTPALLVYTAYNAKQYGVGVNDYASLACYGEFVFSASLLGISYTCGYHVNCKPLFGENSATVFTYGIAKKYVSKANAGLEVFRREKYDYSLNLIDKINARLKKYKINISRSEVFFLSKYLNGGVLCEKHVALVFAEKLIELCGKGDKLIEFLTDVLKIENCCEDLAYIKESGNKYYLQDVAKVLFKHLYIFKVKEMLHEIKDILPIGESTGGINTYYLRIVNEDEEGLDDKLYKLHLLGFKGVTFDERIFKGDINALIDKIYSYDLLPITLIRRSMPRQLLPQVEQNSRLFEVSMALVGHEISTAYSIKDGLFGENSLSNLKDLQSRVTIFAEIGERVNKNV